MVQLPRARPEPPLIGDRRPPSPLGDIQPAGWPAEYTAELLNVLHVLGRLVALEPRQADLLARLCAGPLVPAAALAGLAPSPARRTTKRNERQGELMDD